ncbi:putative membrane protein YqgA involved in biofilm formation [Streptococcus gallinaceus]|nr:putative membrane protein YqgA involved in biofilm formation [Streptococcus gallinaceus]
MIQVKLFPVANMIPAMILVMPLSWFWAQIILQIL